MTSYTELAEVLEWLPLLCREKRRREGISLRTAGEQMGLSFGTVSRIENRQGAHMHNVVLILRWLDGKVVGLPHLEASSDSVG